MAAELFAVLNPVDDRERWDSLFARLPVELRDVHFSSAYARVQRANGQKTLLAAYEWEQMFIVQPFVLQETTIDGEVARDIANPYGYGGPVCNKNWGTGATLYQWFMAAWSEWLCEQGVVCEFCALHPLMTKRQRLLLSNSGASIEFRKLVVCMTLDEGMEGRMHSKHRQYVRKAMRNGVSARLIEPSRANLAMFTALYNDNMRKLRAKDKWLFDLDYIAAHFDELGGSAELMAAFLPDGEVETMLLMIRDQRTAYAHFLASARTQRKIGVDELLYFEAAGAAWLANCQQFHLGGGRSTLPDDNLLRYKAAFSDKTLSAYQYFRVFDEARYKQLCERKREIERATLGREIESSFAPLYRREAA